MDTYMELKHDDRIIKVTYSDYDIASDIMGEWDNHLSDMGLFVSPHERNSVDWGDEDIATGLDNWEEDYNRIAMDLDDATTDYQDANARLENILAGCGWDYSDENALKAMEDVQDRAEIVSQNADELATHINNRPDVRVIEYCPYVDLIRYFRVFVDVETFERETLQDYSVDNVLKVVNAFNAAYRGGIFSISIEDEDEDEINSVSGVTFGDECPTDDEILEYVRDCM